MKRAFLIMVFLRAALGLFPQVTNSGGITVSFSRDSEGMKFDDVQLAYDYSPDFTLQTDLFVQTEVFGIFFARGDITTYANPDYSDGIWLSPYQAEYRASLGASWNGLTVGVVHTCYHPIITAGESYVEKYGGDDRVYLEWRF